MTLIEARCDCRVLKPTSVYLKPSLDERYLVGTCKKCGQTYQVPKDQVPQTLHSEQ